MQQAHLKLSEEEVIQVQTRFSWLLSHVCLTSSCFVVFLWKQSTAYTSLSEFVFMSLLFVFFSFKCFCHQLLFFFSLRNFVLTEHLAEAGGGEECETDEERLWWPYMDNLKIVLLDAGNSSWSLFFLWWLQMKRIEESVHAVFFLCFLLQMFKTFHTTKSAVTISLELRLRPCSLAASALFSFGNTNTRIFQHKLIFALTETHKTNLKLRQSKKAAARFTPQIKMVDVIKSRMALWRP